ncbi:hypothetical protein [Paraferrimonas sp. SM1919]|uniref:hypothetical protein n=1 Tax=Paraferrimonas sp. SM1919 TaxID=2662263 RepID=UPI0013D26479|nr:hypothetical protein [Paraferrimonas sp. SM1919]
MPSDSTLISHAFAEAIRAGVHGLSGATPMVIRDTYQATIVFKLMHHQQVVVSYNGPTGKYTVLS